MTAFHGGFVAVGWDTEFFEFASELFFVEVVVDDGREVLTGSVNSRLFMLELSVVKIGKQ